MGECRLAASHKPRRNSFAAFRAPRIYETTIGSTTFWSLGSIGSQRHSCALTRERVSLLLLPFWRKASESAISACAAPRSSYPCIRTWQDIGLGKIPLSSSISIACGRHLLDAIAPAEFRDAPSKMANQRRSIAVVPIYENSFRPSAPGPDASPLRWSCAFWRRGLLMARLM